MSEYLFFGASFGIGISPIEHKFPDILLNPRSSHPVIGFLLVLSASVMWGFSNVLLKSSIKHGMEPATANAVQTGFSAIFMVLIWIYVVSTGTLSKVNIDAFSLAYLIIGTLVGLAFGTTLYLHGLKLVDASLASPLSSTSPFFVISMSVIFIGENITLSLIFGAIVVFAGVVLLGRKEGGGKRSRKGIVLVSIAPIFWAMTVVLYRVALRSMDIYTANAIRMSILGITMCLYVRLSGSGCFSSERRAIFESAGAGIFNYVLGGTAFLFGLVMIGASRASVLSSGTPFFTMLFAAMFLKERIKRTYIYGGILVVTGLILLSVS